MNKTQVLETVDKIFSNVFDCKNPFTIDELLTKFAFDVKLPQQVNDSIREKLLGLLLSIQQSILQKKTLGNGKLGNSQNKK